MTGIHVLILSLLLLPLFSGCDKAAKTPPPAGPPAVTFIEVQPKDGPVTFEKIAQTQSSQMVNIQARVNGFLEKRLFAEGTLVTKGQPLFQIDPEPFQVAVNQVRAAVARQEQALIPPA